MKQTIKIRKIASLIIMMIMGLVLGTVLDAVSASGITLAVGTAVAGGLVDQQAATGGAAYDPAHEYIDMRDVQRKVELYKPYQTPILTLMSQNKRESCDSWEKKYFAIDARGMNTTVTSTTTISAAGTTTCTVADGSFFTKNNTVFFAISGSTKVSSGRTLMGIVTGIPDTNKIAVLLVNPGNALAASDFTGVAAMRGGTAMNPKAASTGAWGALPEPDYNYVQSFMEQVDIEDFQEKMKKQIDWNLPDMKRAAIDDFKLQLERTFLNGIKGIKDVLVDGETQRVYTCGGFLQDTGVPVTDSITLSTLTEKVLNTLTKAVFTGNNGMKSRYLLGGCDFIEALENVNADKKHILSKETHTELGLDFVRIVSMFGTLNVVYYEQLDLLKKPKTAIVLDKSNLITADFEAFNIRPIDKKTSGIAKVTSVAIEQTSTMLIKNKSTHRILNGV